MVIKNNVLWHSLCGCRRRCLNSLIKTKFNSWDNMSHFVLASIGLNIAKFKLILWLGHCNRIVHVIRGVTGNCRLCEIAHDDQGGETRVHRLNTAVAVVIVFRFCFGGAELHAVGFYSVFYFI